MYRIYFVQFMIVDADTDCNEIDTWSLCEIITFFFFNSLVFLLQLFEEVAI